MFAFAGLGASALAGCSGEVTVRAADSSIDGERVRLLLDSCNADLDFRVAQSPTQVQVTVSRPDVFRQADNDCQDIEFINLDDPLGSRDLVDTSTGATLPVGTPVPGRGDEPDWPWDRDRFTAQDYNGALQAMVECLEDEDPDMTAWVTQALNWDTYDWDKEPVDGRVSVPALETCQARHLEPLA